MKLNEKILENILDTALEAAACAADILLNNWQKRRLRDNADISYRSKDDLSPVTELDLAAEKIIREIILKRFPDHQIVGEEFGKDAHNLSPYTWIIDPIDGTKGYIRGQEYFATQVAVMYEGEVVVGVSNAPALNETLAASKNGGAFLNKKPIQVSKINQLPKAFISHGNLKYFDQIKKLPQFFKVLEKAWTTRGFGDFWGYHLLATGRIDAMLEAKAKIWDIAALSIIVKEAGGAVSDIHGQPLSMESTSMIATNGLIHDEILSTLNE